MELLKRTIEEFVEDRCTTLAAALAYYTAFALPPLLYLMFLAMTVGLSVSYESQKAESEAQRVLTSQAARMIGNQAAVDEISTMLEAQQNAPGKWWKALLGFAGILVGATGVVAALQDSLNQVWDVRPDPDRTGFIDLIFKRILSLGMILGFAFLLLVSLVVSSMVSTLGQQAGSWVGMSGAFVSVGDFTIHAIIDFVVFASIFKFMPDAKIRWHYVFLGATITTALFLLGRAGMQLYFMYSEPGAQFGSAAASLAVLLLWVYYSALIVLFGAEVTQTYAVLYGSGIHPEAYAKKVEEVDCPDEESPEEECHESSVTGEQHDANVKSSSSRPGFTPGATH